MLIVVFSMKKTLIVSYAPREGSHTRELVDYFATEVRSKADVVHCDLATNPPDLLSPEHLSLVVRWNSGERRFSDLEQLKRANHDRLVSQLLSAERVVLAFPIYNFSLPATMKAWIDAVVVMDKTFSFNPAVGFAGLCTGKKAASIVVSGFDYRDSSNGMSEYASSTLVANFGFMGMSMESITAMGLDQNIHLRGKIMASAKREITELVERWY